MSQVTLHSVAAFDKNTGQTFSYNARTLNINIYNKSQFSTKLEISQYISFDSETTLCTSYSTVRFRASNNSTNDGSYVETYHTLDASDASVLSNGTDYYARLSVICPNGDIVVSNTIKIKCLSYPNLLFSNISAINPISTSSYTFEFEYIQAESEILKFYSISLIKDSIEEYSSGSIDCLDDVVPTIIEHNIRNLSNGTYTIIFSGLTVNGISFTYTNQFIVNYSMSEHGGTISAYNDELNCNISINVDYSRRNDIDINDIYSIRVKRKKSGQHNKDYKVIYEQIINTVDDLAFNFYDKYAKSKTNYIYATCLVDKSNEESGLIDSNIVLSKFDKLVICDKDTSYFTEFDIKCNFKKNHNISIVNTLSGTYPYAIKNDNSDYWSGNVSALWILTSNDILDVNNTMGYREQFMNWLNNSNPKILKYPDGRMYLIYVNSGIESSNDDNENKIITSFEWTEIGNSENIDELINNKLLDYCSQ